MRGGYVGRLAADFRTPRGLEDRLPGLCADLHAQAGLTSYSGVRGHISLKQSDRGCIIDTHVTCNAHAHAVMHKYMSMPN